jgi:hypothetical protein
MPNVRSKNGVRERPNLRDTTAVVADRPGPEMSPPSADVASSASSAAAGTAEPTLRPEDVSSQTSAAISESRPTLGPPAGVGAVADAVGAVTATWRSGVNVTALWSINQTRNAFMFVPGVGWRRIFNGRDGAFTALVTLASQARQTGRPIAFREEPDGMVYEIYLW